MEEAARGYDFKKNVMKPMRKMKAIMQGILHSRSAKKGWRLWSMGAVLLFCVVCFLLATRAPSPAFAAGDASLQPKEHAQSQHPQDPPGAFDCPTVDPFYSAQCANDTAEQGASATWTPNNGNIQNPIVANSTLMFFTDSAYTSGQPAVSTLWGAMLGIVGCFVVLVLVLNGMLIMLGSSVFRYAKAIEAIPRVLLALIVATISMTFITLTLGLNNVLSQQLYQWAQNNNLQSTNFVHQKFNVTYSLDWLGNTTVSWEPQDPSTGYSQAPSIKNCTRDSSDKGGDPYSAHLYDCTWPTFTITPQNVDFTKIDVASSMKSIPGALDLMIDIMALMLIAQVVIRIFFIDVYIVLAPIGIGCWALPADIGRGITSMWFKGFISTVLVQFVQVVAIIVTQLILGALLGALTGSGKISNAVVPIAILDKLVNVALLWFIFRIPSMFNTAPTRSMVEIGSMMTQTVSSFVGMQIAEAQTSMAEAWGAGEAAAGIGAMLLLAK